jgi:hypothetical protein
VGEHRRGNPAIFELIVAEKSLAGDLLGRSKPFDAPPSTVCIDFSDIIEFNHAEFETFLRLPLPRPPGTFPGNFQ